MLYILWHRLFVIAMGFASPYVHVASLPSQRSLPERWCGDLTAVCSNPYRYHTTALSHEPRSTFVNAMILCSRSYWPAFLATCLDGQTVDGPEVSLSQ